MVLCASVRQGMPHLFSGLIALGVAAAVLLGGGIVAVHLEHATIVSTAPELFPLKKQGLAFQRAAAHARSVLPLYGDRKSTRLNSSHSQISYAVFCLKKKKN